MNRRHFMGVAGAAALVAASNAPTQSKLFALIHDGYFDGDSEFYFPDNAVPYSAGMTIGQLKEAYIVVLRERLKGFGYHQQEIDAEVQDVRECVFENIKGAVVVDEKVIKALKAIWESDPGSDSGVYGCNRSAKRVAWCLKQSFIGKEMEG